MAAKKSPFLTFRYFAEYAVIRFVVAIFSVLPAFALDLLARFMGWLMSILQIRKKVITKNLRIVFGDDYDRALIKKIYRHTGFMFADLIRFMSHVPVLHIKNPEVVKKIQAEKKAVIAVSMHQGNWEILGYFGETCNMPVSAVAKPIHNPYLNQYVEHMREKQGVNLIYTRKRMLIRMIKALKQRNAIGFLLDQNAKKRGIMLPFFSKEASTFTGPAVLSLKYKLKIIFAWSMRNSDGTYSLFMDDVIDPEIYLANSPSMDDAQRAMLLDMNQRMEKVIRKHPDQWFWFHKRWD